MKRAAVALIDEPRCIGCTRCIEACPFDAITGAQGLMHTVIAAYCPGCKLCLPACPVDCIDMVARPVPWTQGDERDAKRRAALRGKRLAREKPAAFQGDRKAVISRILKQKRAR